MAQLFTLQFSADRFSVKRYNNKYTWMNYWYQTEAVFRTEPSSVLEIGPGNQTVTDVLRKAGIAITTVDVDPELHPDVVASVVELPFLDNSFDTVLCSEVLEHLPYDQFTIALTELRRVSKKHLILGLPNAGAVLEFSMKLPLLQRLNLFTKIPFFWKSHVFKSGHYWETGKKGFSKRKILNSIKSVGFRVTKEGIRADDPAHWLLELESDKVS